MSCNLIFADGNEDVKLGQVLYFSTGSKCPPPLGFDNPISIHFNPASDFPMASTCALQLILPTKYHDEETLFPRVYGISNHGGFGMC